MRESAGTPGVAVDVGNLSEGRGAQLVDAAAGIGRGGALDRSATTSTCDCSIEPPLVSHWRSSTKRRHARRRSGRSPAPAAGCRRRGTPAGFRRRSPGDPAPRQRPRPVWPPRAAGPAAEFAQAARPGAFRTGTGLRRIPDPAACRRRRGQPRMRKRLLACRGRPALRDASEAVDQGHGVPCGMSTRSSSTARSGAEAAASASREPPARGRRGPRQRGGWR